MSCFKKLQGDIVNGVYAPGEKLSMSKLKEALNVGQSPIREALMRLVSKNLVRLEENKGFRVMPISHDDLSDLYRTLSQTEYLTIKQSVELGDDKWEINLVARFHQLAMHSTKKLPIDQAAWVESCYAFHRALILGCQSPTLIHFHDYLFLRLERYIKLVLKFDNSLVDYCYERKKTILDAALNRDSETTAHIFVENLMGSFDLILSTLKKNGCL